MRTGCPRYCRLAVCATSLVLCYVVLLRYVYLTEIHVLWFAFIIFYCKVNGDCHLFAVAQFFRYVHVILSEKDACPL